MDYILKKGKEAFNFTIKGKATCWTELNIKVGECIVAFRNKRT